MIAVVTVILTDTGAGTGVYSFSLPVTAANTEVHVGGAYGYDASEAVKFYAGAVRLYTTTTMQIRGGGATGWASTVPFTWTTDDQIHMQLTYEAANVD